MTFRLRTCCCIEALSLYVAVEPFMHNLRAVNVLQVSSPFINLLDFIHFPAGVSERLFSPVPTLSDIRTHIFQSRPTKNHFSFLGSVAR